MATPYTDVYDLFMQQIKDYSLVELYNLSDTDFETYLQGFLVLAIGEFIHNCTQDLTNRDDANGTFSFDLDEENQIILSKYMVKYWLAKEVKDVLQMNLNLTDRDFKHYSEAQNLKSKQDFLIMLTEECSQMLVDYQFRKVDWSSWASGEFGV